MMTYYFRLMQDKKPNGWVGFAMAKNKHDLFWTIDEFCDPYSVQIKKAYRAGYCKLVSEDEDEPDTLHEFSESEWDAFHPDERWQTPNWGDVFNEKELKK